MSYNFCSRVLSLRQSLVHWIPCKKTHNLKKKFAQKFEEKKSKKNLVSFYRKWAITFVLGHFHLNEVFFIEFLAKKHTI